MESVEREARRGRMGLFALILGRSRRFKGRNIRQPRTIHRATPLTVKSRRRKIASQKILGRCMHSMEGNVKDAVRMGVLGVVVILAAGMVLAGCKSAPE